MWKQLYVYCRARNLTTKLYCHLGPKAQICIIFTTRKMPFPLMFWLTFELKWAKTFFFLTFSCKISLPFKYISTIVPNVSLMRVKLDLSNIKKKFFKKAIILRCWPFLFLTSEHFFCIKKSYKEIWGIYRFSHVFEGFLVFSCCWWLFYFILFLKSRQGSKEKLDFPPLVFGIVIEIPRTYSILRLRLLSKNLPAHFPKHMLSVLLTGVHLLTQCVCFLQLIWTGSMMMSSVTAALPGITQ